MTPNDNADIVGILQGYEAWRRHKLSAATIDLDPLSVSHYIDELARQRAYDAVTEIRAAYANPELTWAEVDTRIRGILGVK